MLTNKQQAMFESIARGNPAFRDYLASELEQQHEVLVKAVDGDQVRRAQGHAQRLKSLIDHLDAAMAPKRP